MGAQFIGLMLLVSVLSIGIYASTHYSELINLKINLPLKISLVDLPNAIPAGSAKKSGGPDLSWFPVTDSGKLMKISSVRQPTQFEPYWDIVLSSGLGGSEGLNITGWVLKTNRGTFTIPRAQEVYSFGGVQGNIVLRPGEQVHLYSGRAIRGNFRLNKCLGYTEIQPFLIPQIPKECPYASRSDISGLGGACQNYISSLRSCEVPSANPPVPFDDGSCRAFLNKLNYVGCVEKYRNDYDFLFREWRVWIEDQGNIFDLVHDKVQLIDSNGKAVDEYIY